MNDDIELMAAAHAVHRALDSIADENNRHMRATMDLHRDLALANAVLAETKARIPALTEA